jgi:hypothetical protein
MAPRLAASMTTWALRWTMIDLYRKNRRQSSVQWYSLGATRIVSAYTMPDPRTRCELVFCVHRAAVLEWRELPRADARCGRVHPGHGDGPP